MGKVIAAFAGTGKSFLGEKYPNTIDLDLGSFRWVYDDCETIPYEQRKAMRVFQQNPDWPENYINAILDAKQKYDLVLVSNTPEITHLIDHSFMPTSWTELEQRYRARNNPERFIEIFKSRFEAEKDLPATKIPEGKYLEHALIDEGWI